MSNNHSSEQNDEIKDGEDLETGGPSSGSQTLGEFYKEVNSIKDMIREIRNNIAALRDLYKRTLTVDTEDESSRMSRQIDLLISETSRISSEISRKLTIMEQSNKSLGGQDQAQKRLTQHAALVKEFMDTMTSYRDMQTENARKFKERITEQYRKVNPDATQEEISQFIDNDTNKIQSSSESDQSNTIISEIQDRQRDVRRIENSINELKNIGEIRALVIGKEKEKEVPSSFIEMIQDNNNIPQNDKIVRIPKRHHKNRKNKLMIMLAIILILVVLGIIVSLIVFFAIFK
ncbi:t-SNARE [Gigaspora margarita]|uniref:t-SNARE n=2 Tax=Gigaspora margarita TaxID=4874 RepID=A0A8H4AGH3_GIGMA|nr:t-SNARE [Gigaspora margarita]